MAYLKLRRLTELLVLDHPQLASLFRARGPGPSAAPKPTWEALYEGGAYDNLLDSDKRHHHRLLAGLIAERAPNGRILEVGCGQGAFYESLRQVKPRRYLGVDISERAIDQARGRFARDVAAGAAEFRAFDGAAFECDERFDAIVFADCIEYLGPVEGVIARYAPLLAPGGVFGLTQWLALHPLAIWRRLSSLTEVLEEVVVNTPSGRAWQVAVVRPPAASGAVDG